MRSVGHVCADAVPCILQKGWQEVTKATLHLCLHEGLHILADKAAPGEGKLAVEVRDGQLQGLQAILEALHPPVIQLYKLYTATAAAAATHSAIVESCPCSLLSLLKPLKAI